MDQSQIIKDFLREELLLFEDYFRQSLKSDNPRVAEMISHVFNSNGKRLRPILVLLTAKACGRIIPETYHGAVTVELLHTATLIHDDVIDKSDMRRGKKSVNAVFDNTKAVLIGDYLLSTALMESVKTRDLGIVSIISELGQNLSEGELDQYSLASDVIIDEDAYFDVIDKKTASLMRASITIGAITGGAGIETIERFRELGGLLGICFQIRDDIFDYYQTDIGKPTGNDIREGKITLPLIYALKNAPQDLSKEMIGIITSRDYTEDNITKLLMFARNNRGVEHAYRRMDEFLDEAEKIIADFTFDNNIKSLMRLFLVYLRERAY
ncbi:polyprenyl synthetase family protein [Proteiniphilum sp. UBA1028]|jgi:octaprenyl-diphosphate synthase|uniref:polyprenyl synthetase family protein n=1 Tax=Proteiniphilum sp. UBA1028 TaxID=1947251 RepID=UPI000E85C5B5|nr:polyprenyl synthetase family protein [Proteiniphilum sp. UBA1028]HBG58773.1 polyprenyl synthetase [Porphyromonadaceae bacterium]